MNDWYRDSLVQFANCQSFTFHPATLSSVCLSIIMSESRKQVWSTINNFPNYEIADFPEYKLKKDHPHGIQVLKKDTQEYVKIWKEDKGYRMVNLWQDGNEKKVRIGRLVAIAFIPNPDNHPQVDHKDRLRKDDDDVTNLRWVTHTQNIQNRGKMSRNNRGCVPTSEYKGVSWEASAKRWLMSIVVWIDGKRKAIQRRFKKESEARDAYDAWSTKYQTHGLTNATLFKPEYLAMRDKKEAEDLAKEAEEEEEEEKVHRTSEYKGVSWCDNKNRWRMSIWVEVELNGKKTKKQISRYRKRESEARDAYDATSIQYHKNELTNMELFGADELAKRDQKEREEEEELANVAEEEEEEEEEEKELQWENRSQTVQNRGTFSSDKNGDTPSSEYIGVGWEESRKRWKMSIWVEIEVGGKKKKKKVQRRFQKESEARNAFDAAVRFYRTNHRTNLDLFGAEELAKRDKKEAETLAREAEEDEEGEDEEEEEEDEEPEAKRVKHTADRQVNVMVSNSSNVRLTLSA